jgi:hypothetical protein
MKLVVALIVDDDDRNAGRLPSDCHWGMIANTEGRTAQGSGFIEREP